VILTIALLSVASGRFARGTVLVVSLLFVQSGSHHQILNHVVPGLTLYRWNLGQQLFLKEVVALQP
jgi:Gpi18-like mannosyltransferase